jgi:excinuclease UvrABC nuclease subunit
MYQKWMKYIERIEYIKCKNRFEYKNKEKRLIEKYKPGMNDVLAIQHIAISKLEN